MRVKSFVSKLESAFVSALITKSERYFVAAFLLKVNAYDFRPYPVGESTAPHVEAVCARPRPSRTGRSERSEPALSGRHSRRVDHCAERRARRVPTAHRRLLRCPRAASLRRLARDRRAPQGQARPVLRKVFRCGSAAEEARRICAGAWRERGRQSAA